VTIPHKAKLYQVLLRWFLIIGLVSLSLGLGSYLLFSYQSEKDYAVNNLNNNRDQQVIIFESWLEDQTQTIAQFALTPTVKKENLIDVKKLFGNYLEKVETEFESIFFADINGKVLIDATDENPMLYVGDRSYFVQAMNGENYISEVVLSRKDGNPIFIISSPVYSEDDEIIGAVFGGIPLSRLSSLFTTFRSGYSGETFLVDNRGLMLTESRFTKEFVERGLIKETTQNEFIVNTPAVTNVINGKSGFKEYTNCRDKYVMAAYQWLPDLNWGLVVEIEKEEIMGNWINQIIAVIVVIFLIMILVIGPLSRYMAGKIVAPLLSLTERLDFFTVNYKSDVLSWTALETFVYQEVERLSQSFYSMAEKLGQLMENLETQAQHDALTGLANRHYFSKRSLQIVELTQRNNRECSMIFLDIDEFKIVNDTYGHSVGDTVLVHIARLLERSIRFSDVIGRFGGDEFTIILPDTNIKGAKYFAERIRTQIDETPLQIDEDILHITVSIGVAVYYGTNARINRQEVLENLINRADTAMYKAKTKSRNRVEYDYGNEDEKQLKIFLEGDGEEE
jgi:diguanylate cyclase (GGDEF)-like protein